MIRHERSFSLSGRFPSPRFQANWVKRIQGLDPTETGTKSYRAFQKVFSNPATSMDGIYPKLNRIGQGVVLQTFPERAAHLINLDPGPAISSLSVLSLDRLLPIIFKILEERGELSKPMARLVDTKMNRSELSRVFAGLEACPKDLQKVLYASLSFEMQLIIFGNAERRHECFLADFWQRYKEVIGQNLSTGFLTITRCFCRVPESFWPTLLCVLDREQLMKMLSFVTPEQFNSVKEIYLDHFKRQLTAGEMKQLTHSLRQSWNSDLKAILEIMQASTKSEEVKTFIQKDGEWREQYLHDVITQSGKEKRIELVFRMRDNDQFFSIQPFFDSLVELAKNCASPRGVRRVYLLASKYLEEHGEAIFQLYPQLGRLNRVELKDELAVKIQAQLKEEVDELMSKKFASQLLDLLESENLEVAEVVFGYLSFTSTPHLIQAIQSRLLTAESDKSKNKMYDLLSGWLKTHATREDYQAHKSVLEGIKTMVETSRSFKNFVSILHFKSIVEEDSSSTIESPPSPRKKIDIEEVLTNRGKKRQHLDSLEAIAFDLKDYARELFARIPFSEFIQLDWLKNPESDSAVNTMIRELDRLSEFAELKILEEDSNTRLRGRVIEFFIGLSETLYSNADFHSSFALYAALNSKNIQRLKKSWKCVNESHREKYKKLESGFEMGNNFQALRQKMKWMAQSGYHTICPGIYLMSHDLKPIQENQDDLLGDQMNISKLKGLSSQFLEFYSWKILCAQGIRKRSRSTIRQSINDMEADVDLWRLSLQCETART